MVLPVLTMPDGDTTHPVPDLTGYITEGQIVFSAELHAHGTYPPIDPLSSLSRLMRKGAGPGRPRIDHLDLAAQLLTVLSRARQTRELSELIGTATLSYTDRLYLEFEEVFRDHLLTQRVPMRPPSSTTLWSGLGRYCYTCHGGSWPCFRRHC
jgi:V/A-type H+/Na+-transporting ATPase subunit B